MEHDRTIVSSSRTKIKNGRPEFHQRYLRAQFYRQNPLGHFIVDSYCPSARLVIEIDGGQHYTEEGMTHDISRDVELSGMGLCVLRFSNLDVLCNMVGVIDQLVQHLDAELGKGETKSP